MFYWCKAITFYLSPVLGYQPQDEYLEPGKKGEGMGPTKTRRKSGKQKPRAPAPDGEC